MEIKLKKNSWHFKLYSTVISDTPPSSLCPYFWTLVVLVLVSPMIGIAYLVVKSIDKISAGISWLKLKFKKEGKPKPSKTIEDYIDEWKREEEASKRRAALISKIGKGLLITVFVMLVLLLTIYGKKENFITLLIALGISLNIVLVVIGTISVCETFNLEEKLAKFTPLKWIKQSSPYQLLVGMIVATYTKMCPLIKWEQVKEKENA